jgi:hypothetical protein
MLTRREVIAAKVESTYRTDSSPGAGDAVYVVNPTYGSEANMVERSSGVKNSLAPFQDIYGGRLATISFDVEVKHSGTVDTAPEIGVLLQGCGFGETVNASTSVVYEPVSTGFDSLTILYYQDGKLKKLLGARGSVSFAGASGGLLVASFSFVGHSGSITDSAIISPTYDASIPPVMLSAGFNWAGEGSTNLSLENFSLDVGLEVSKPKDMNEANGYGEILITSRKITGTFDPLDVLDATIDFYDQWESGTLGAIVFDIGTAGGNQVNFSMPKSYITGISEGDREGQRMLEIAYSSIENTSNGDDDLTITFN